MGKRGKKTGLSKKKHIFAFANRQNDNIFNYMKKIFLLLTLLFAGNMMQAAEKSLQQLQQEMQQDHLLHIITH